MTSEHEPAEQTTAAPDAAPSATAAPDGTPGDWHARSVEAVLEALNTGLDGLPADEAQARLARFGPNRLRSTRRSSAWRRLLSQFHNVLIYVLLAAAVLAALLGHAVDAAVILAVVIVNAVVGFTQEGRAEQALAAISALIDPKASVLRHGRRVVIGAEAIVPGDLVLLEAGDRVPADLRLSSARNLRVEEAVLTGESLPVEKAVAAVAQPAELGDRTSMAFSGTFVAAGQGAGVAVGTGADTELGRISTLVQSVEQLKTPLIRQIDEFGKRLTWIILAAAGLTFAVALLVQDYPLSEAFMAVVGLAVAAIPEGLPAVMTITLAMGVQRMAARRAIIRRLPAAETLGSVSVICSDKTGTLTRNEMTARTVVGAGRVFDISGVGYEPVGAIRSDDRELTAADEPLLGEIARLAALCNDAELREQQGTWQVTGDPMEGALLTLACKAGVDPEASRRRVPRTEAIPFDAAHRYMATLHDSPEEGGFVLVKGAPERVLDMCDLERTADGGTAPVDAHAWRERIDRLAAQGQRVLGFATKRAEAGQQAFGADDVEQGAVLLGLVGFIDPPRQEAIDAVADCRTAGIRVLMITGDHAATAREIARQLGIDADPQVLTGQELEQLGADALRDATRVTHVFARTTPEHKLRLVEALQAQGLTIAMTGDGVNDAPALKRADVGVAMGGKGTEAAKEAAEVVLADDNFASIVAAVREGRTIYDNLTKVLAWTLPTNGGEALTILLAIALGLTLPITPVQILWVNMITAVGLGLTLAFEPGEPGTMRRPPRAAHAPLLDAELLWRIGFVSVLFVAGAFGVFLWAQARGLPIETGRTLVVNTLVIMEIAYLFSVRHVHGASLTVRGVLGTPAVLLGVAVVTAAQFAMTYLPFMQVVFETTAVSLLDGLVVVGAGVALLLVVELEKPVRRAVRQRSAPYHG